jgi:hypothetical protein
MFFFKLAHDRDGSPVTILYDHGILNWSLENANAEQEPKADPRDCHFKV